MIECKSKNYNNQEWQNLTYYCMVVCAQLAVDGGGGRCIVGLPQITSKCNPFRSLDQYPLPCRRVVSLALQVEVVFGFCG